MVKKTLFLACTHPMQPTGYARVGCALANGFATLGWDVVVYGFQNIAPVAPDRVLDPRVRILDVAAITGNSTGFGETVWAELVHALKPTAAIVYNDVFVVNAYLDALYAIGNVPGTKLVAYLDLVHDSQNFVDTIASRVNQVWVFSEHWKSYVRGNVHVIPHGLDPCFVPIDRRKARASLQLPLDGYIVLNSNRNSYRKALDVTLRVFLDAYVTLGQPDDLYLFLNCRSVCETGYNVPSLIRSECARRGLDADMMSSTRILGMHNAGFLRDETLNALYNACDVGLNTSVGEGFGLMALELGSLRKPLIVNGTGGARDLMGSAAVDPIETLELCAGFVAHGGRMDVPDSKEMTRRLVDLYRAKCTAQDPPFDPDMYSWDSVCKKAVAALLGS